MSRSTDTAAQTPFRGRYGPAALVTGAAGGIGRAFADALAERGLSVLMLDVQAAVVETAAAEVAGKSPPPITVIQEHRQLDNVISEDGNAHAAGRLIR